MDVRNILNVVTITTLLTVGCTSSPSEIPVKTVHKISAAPRQVPVLPPSPGTERHTAPTPSTYVVHILTGSLKASLIKIVEDHGYTLGAWNFGRAGYTKDWLVEKAYNYPVNGDLVTVLQEIKRTYGLLGTLNELDKTVDFEAATADGSSKYAL